uniref:Fatty acid-binding protein type IV n=1 Tax=Fasciola hepatica TaxID=6192 RepID=A0A0U1YYN9_FASHE|nr:fatty acid-binding protein type IV [Fasciola hepatica]
MEAFVGKWKLDSYENVDAILNMLSFTDEEKEALLSNVVLELQIPKENTMKIHSNSNLFQQEFVFPVNEEFQTVSADGTSLRGIVEKISDTKLTYTQKHPILRVTATSEILNKANILTINFLGKKSTFKFQKI